MHARTTHAQTIHRTSRTGFTLIEIMVVIAIIAILTAIALLVGNRVTQGARATLTKDLLKVLDQAYVGVLADRDGKTPSIFRDDDGNEFPVFDGRVNPMGFDAMMDLVEPSQVWFTLSMGSSSTITESIRRADAKFVVNAYVLKDPPLAAPPGCTPIQYVRTAMPKAPQKAGTLDACELPQINTQFPGHKAFVVPYLKDAWGNPIRFVHPKFQGGFGDYANATGGLQTRSPSSVNFQFGGGPQPFTLRRSYRPFGSASATSNSIGDADEGLCTGGAGYFYSPGPDKDPGTRSDNVYISTPPVFPTETARF